MNINKMLLAQAELDNFTWERSKIKEYPLNQIMLALRVELGELAQEWGEFKYWKKSRKETDKAALIEEWADCMHFALSLESDRTVVTNIDRVNMLVDFFIVQYNIYEVFDKAFKKSSLASIIALGYKLGFSGSELEQAYFDKNKKNWERMRGDY